MSWQASLERGAVELGVPLTEEQVEKFVVYLRLLSEWSGKVNLTSLHDPAEIGTRHFLDSLALVASLPVMEGEASLIDVGSGGGFPGVVCGIVQRGLHVTCVERVHKKAAFLMLLRRELGLDLEVRPTDVSAVKETFDIAVSRATFPPEVWLERGMPLIKVGGALVCMLGDADKQLVPPPGLSFLSSRTYELAGLEQRRRIVLWTKREGCL